MKKENRYMFETEATARKRIEQVQALREQVKEGGLKFETYLTPRVAKWILDMVEKGDFLDPGDAVYHLTDQARELWPHHDLRQELLRRMIQAGIDSGISTQSHEEIFEDLRKEMKRSRPEPARWVKIKQEGAET